MEGLFEIGDGVELNREYSFMALFKFFAITLIKTLVLTYKYKIDDSEFEYFNNLIKKVSLKISFENYSLKFIVLNIIRAMIFKNFIDEEY